MGGVANAIRSLIPALESRVSCGVWVSRAVSGTVIEGVMGGVAELGCGETIRSSVGSGGPDKSSRESYPSVAEQIRYASVSL